MKLFRNMYQKSKEQKGFTLVEMIVVLVIIAILAAITIPALLKYIDKAKDKQLVINARTAYLAAETAASEVYAAGYTVPSGKTITFGKASTTNDVGGFVANAQSLTGRDDHTSYTCKVTFNTDWKITQVDYTEGGKTASLTVASGSGWTVKP